MPIRAHNSPSRDATDAYGKQIGTRPRSQIIHCATFWRPFFMSVYGFLRTRRFTAGIDSSHESITAPDCAPQMASNSDLRLQSQYLQSARHDTRTFKDPNDVQHRESFDSPLAGNSLKSNKLGLVKKKKKTTSVFLASTSCVETVQRNRFKASVRHKRKTQEKAFRLRRLRNYKRQHSNDFEEFQCFRQIGGKALFLFLVLVRLL
jgi:hypothetical protein